MVEQKLESLRLKGYDFDIRESINKGFAMFLHSPIQSIAYTLFILSIQMTFALYLSDYVVLYSLFLAPPLYGGYYLAANKISQEGSLSYSDFFWGFQYFMPLFSIWLIGQLLVALGIVLFIVPGIYLAVSYTFAMLMAIFGGFDFWKAMEESRKLVAVRWWKFLSLFLVLLGINLIGILTLVGLLVSLPLTFYVVYVIFEGLTKEVFAE